MRLPASLFSIVCLFWCTITSAGDSGGPSLTGDILPLLKTRCVKCHGPVKREGRFNLGTARGLAAGGESGRVIDRAEPLKSLLWRRIDEGEMPPDEPLSSDERALVRRWLAAGAEGLPDVADSGEETGHWAFERIGQSLVPEPTGQAQSAMPIDRFLEAALQREDLSFSPEADRYTLLRRLSFDLLGLPPTPDEIHDFVHDDRPDAYERLVDRYLASPHHGERWGKHWLDAAGYADSNGYFNADTDRPLAYRYRDYVVDSFNRNRPFDQFIREQLAGDELAGYRPGSEVLPEQVELLVATHFLRNSQDGTGESDGNPDEVRADRYSVLEGTQQIIGSALLGLTLQCARCHDHKFEPVTQVDYYRLQAILAGAFDPENWLKPNERQAITASAAEIAAWEGRMREIDDRIAALRRDFTDWVRANRPRGEVVFEDHFDDADLALRWTNVAPGDDAAGGSPAVQLGSTGAASVAPAALVRSGALNLIESGSAGNRWLSTTGSFDWSPDEPGDTVQVTFDLVADRVQPADQPAARIGFYIALHDYNDNSGSSGGNILIDGNPQGGAAIHVDYPGDDSRPAGQIGTSGYRPGHNYGVRITNSGDGRYLMEQLVDDVPEANTVTLAKEDLPLGGFGFEFCCGRSFVVDNVMIERSSKGQSAETATAWPAEYKKRREEVEAAVGDVGRQRSDKPGKTAVVLDVSATPPEWFLLVRGNYSQHGAKVEPGAPGILEDPDHAYSALPTSASSGRRLALARWLTSPNSRAAALLARVTVNRVWQHHFGTGICATPDNLGYSGSPPSHPELLDYLAGEFVRGGWLMKPLHRAIVLSRAYRQSSQPREDALKLDPDDRLLWRFPLRRLDAESLRDAALSLTGELDRSMGGSYVPTDRNGQGEIIVDESKTGSHRRGLYLQQRRTQVLSLLELFDAPSIVTNCTRRSSATTALQSLSLLNSEFTLARAHALAGRLATEHPADMVQRAFLLTAGRPPDAKERAASERFLTEHRKSYPDRPDGAEQALVDFCQMLLASNAFLYIE